MYHNSSKLHLERFPSVNIANLILCFSLVIMFVLLKLVILELEIY